MSRTPSIDGEAITDGLPYDEAKHFITITRKEYNELIHDSEVLRVLKEHGLDTMIEWHAAMANFYPDNINPDDWRKDR